MNTISTRDNIQYVAEKWRRAYGKGAYANDPQKQGIQQGLDALDLEAATADEVDAIIGNASWTRNICNECNRRVDTVVQVGEPDDYESRTAYLCYECVKNAVALMDSV